MRAVKAALKAMQDNPNQHARRLFDGIASHYDLLAELFCLFQYHAWRRYLVSRLNADPEDTVLDLCTGTAGVALEVARTYHSRVVGVDLSAAMLKEAQTKLSRNGAGGRVTLAMGRAENLPFRDASLDAVCVTYLLRYVEDAEATLKEIVRVLKPGGCLTTLEFGVPENRIARILWYAYTRGVLPLAGALVSPGWREVGSFLGPSISRLDQSYPEAALLEVWGRLGIPDVQVKHLSLGGGVVMWGTKSG